MRFPSVRHFLISGLFLCKQILAATYEKPPEDPSAVPQSCGFNSLVAALYACGKTDFDVASVQSPRKLGSVPFSNFAQISEALNSFGLYSLAVHSDSLADLESVSEGWDVAIIQTRKQNADHFVTLLKSSSRRYLADYPNPLTRCDNLVMTDLQSGVYTGSALLISRSQAKLAALNSSVSPGAQMAEPSGAAPAEVGEANLISGESLVVPISTSIDKRDYEKNELSARCVIRNKGDREVMIGDIKGSCGCFISALGSRRIMAGSAQEFTLMFRANAFPNEEGSSVAFSSDDSGCPFFWFR